MSNREEKEAAAGEAAEKKADAAAPKAGTGKLTLFNHSKNPYHLGTNPDGTPRVFHVGKSLECKDQAEYDALRVYKGMSTTAQVAPGLTVHIQSLNDKIAAQAEEIEALKKQNEKFGGKGR